MSNSTQPDNQQAARDNARKGAAAQGDPSVHSKGTAVSLLGLGVQAAIAAAMAVYGRLGGDDAAITAAWAAGLGLPVWLAMAALSHQRKLAATEAGEAELYAASDASKASVFNERPEDLRVAARRLAWFVRRLLPAISVAVAAVMAAVGWWRLADARAAIDGDGFVAPERTGWAVSVGVGVAAVGFVFARFVAGMAKQDAWAHLRAGAAAAAGAAILGAVLAAAHAAANGGVQAALAYTPAAVAVGVLVVAAEIVFNVVLDTYRPKNTQETPRPAIESRVLGFVAAPDRIAESIGEAVNYQFGFNVSSTWFYRLLRRQIVVLGVLGGAVAWMLTMFVVVNPNERAILVRLGDARQEVGPGLHVKWLWPLEKTVLAPASTVRTIVLGDRNDNTEEETAAPLLWTGRRGEVPQRLIARPGSGGDGKAGNAGDALVEVDVVIEYEIVNLRKYLALAADGHGSAATEAQREAILRVVARREMMAAVANAHVDDLLGAGRDAVAQELGQRLAGRLGLDGLDAGVRLLTVSVLRPRPAADQEEEVPAAFLAIAQAQQEKDATIHKARAEAAETLATVAGSPGRARKIYDAIRDINKERAAGASEAELQQRRRAVEILCAGQEGAPAGWAAETLAVAREQRWRTILQARRDAQRHQTRVALYRAAPAYYTASRYLAEMADAVAGATLYLTPLTPDVSINLEETNSAFTADDLRGDE